MARIHEAQSELMSIQRARRIVVFTLDGVETTYSRFGLYVKWMDGGNRPP